MPGLQKRMGRREKNGWPVQRARSWVGLPGSRWTEGMTRVQVFDGTGCNVDVDRPRIRWARLPDDPAEPWVGDYGKDRVSIIHWEGANLYYAYHRGSVTSCTGRTREQAAEALVAYLGLLSCEDDLARYRI